MKTYYAPHQLSMTTLVILLFAGLGYVLFNKDQRSQNNPCFPHLTNTSYNADDSASITLFMLGEIHDQNAEQVRACLASLMQSGDRLVIEFPDQGKIIPCDSVYKSYAMFNGAVECFGFDVPFNHKNRELMFSYWVRADFINMHFDALFTNVKTSSDVIKKFESVLNTYLQLPESAYPKNPVQNDDHKLTLEFYQKNYLALKKLIPKMLGLSLAELRHFIVSENHEYAKRSNHYFSLARKGDTNKKLVVEISRHLRELKGSSHRLFVVAGRNHIDPKIHTQLTQVIADGPATMIFL